MSIWDAISMTCVVMCCGHCNETVRNLCRPDFERSDARVPHSRNGCVEWSSRGGGAVERSR